MSVQFCVFSEEPPAKGDLLVARKSLSVQTGKHLYVAMAEQPRRYEGHHTGLRPYFCKILINKFKIS
ncbi:unnamed protein product [Brassica rapa]|uniref:Uncharacterized protein n=2 Tax=Brassica TaxID=3705 RepID=A0A3P6CPI5_BRACM|nr:unnamed protein product [Brassica napus]CAG7910007.1 unnamed protein product [Brassica rapa]CDY42472.1 BnaA10g08480D [Brassica napus]VDD17576.1 unnamed protein product [Brassica rapa]